jgi:hypothetical protein
MFGASATEKRANAAVLFFHKPENNVFSASYNGHSLLIQTTKLQYFTALSGLINICHDENLATHTAKTCQNEPQFCLATPFLPVAGTLEKARFMAPLSDTASA